MPKWVEAVLPPRAMARRPLTSSASVSLEGCRRPDIPGRSPELAKRIQEEVKLFINTLRPVRSETSFPIEPTAKGLRNPRIPHQHDGLYAPGLAEKTTDDVGMAPKVIPATEPLGGHFEEDYPDTGGRELRTRPIKGPTQSLVAVQTMVGARLYFDCPTKIRT
jgi:hypothetical protein